MPRRQRTNLYRERAALRQSQPAPMSYDTFAADPLDVHRVPTGDDLLALDHVALSVADPAALAAFLCDHLGMHELSRSADVTVVGAGDRAATLVLVAADASREPGALERLVLRIADVERAVAALPAGTAVEGDRLELATFQGPEGLGLGFTMVAGGGIDYDLDHVVLRVSDPDQTRAALAEAGWVPRGQALHVTDKYVTLNASPQHSEHPERSLLDHIAVRVDSVDAVAAQAHVRGLEVDERVADDAFGIVLPGPERIRLHFVH
ncbi:MAG: hypothetical protein AVDCRST_MAG67-1287 [uncultured Solirubrobacteraceae bacterium]|uniref:VOC domain-containing protein n=1 Tax=uncultured Solirubrobacteraceae bacterium TaxID=1162706 RepID=A0A6J4SA11_9ACTN|nr:MAG: hypothetical protein AVDCRST_MAG67-1287 [uncultured Solirubrobacteraceae bacterium]